MCIILDLLQKEKWPFIVHTACGQKLDQADTVLATRGDGNYSWRTPTLLKRGARTGAPVLGPVSRATTSWCWKWPRAPYTFSTIPWPSGGRGCSFPDCLPQMPAFRGGSNKKVPEVSHTFIQKLLSARHICPLCSVTGRETDLLSF